jgi:hypothetical protein
MTIRLWTAFLALVAHVNIFWVATAKCTNLQNRRLNFSAVAFPALFFVGQIIVLSSIAYQT